MLAGLDSDYDPSVTSVTIWAEPMGLNDMYAHLLSYEMPQEQHNHVFQVSGSLSNTVAKGNRCGRGRGKQGAQRGQFLGQGNGGNTADNSTGNRPVCHVCGKMRHMTLKCYHCFDCSYQSEDNRVVAAVTNTWYDVDTNWYVDTGATDHITSDLDKLRMKEKYTGGDQVHANGTGMAISRIVYSLLNTGIHCLHLNNVLHVPSTTRNFDVCPAFYLYQQSVS